jgi:hypothetical protein
LSILISFSSFCQKNTDDNFDGKIYSNSALGWAIEVPENWELITPQEFKEIEEIGKKMSDYEVDMSGLKYLIGFKKNSFNFFQSSSEYLYHPEKWKFYEKGLKEMIFNDYISNGIQVDTTATKKIKVDGVEFQYYKILIYNSKGDLVLNQLLFSGLINNMSFGVNINYH